MLQAVLLGASYSTSSLVPDYMFQTHNKTFAAYPRPNQISGNKIHIRSTLQSINLAATILVTQHATDYYNTPTNQDSEFVPIANDTNYLFLNKNIVTPLAHTPYDSQRAVTDSAHSNILATYHKNILNFWKQF